MIVVALGLFALLPKAELFDQFPDAVRLWFGFTDPVTRIRAAGVAALAFALLAVAVFVLGRRRTASFRAARDGDYENSVRPGYGYWFVVPVAFTAIAVVLVFVHGAVWFGLALVAGFALLFAGVRAITVRRLTAAGHEVGEAPLRGESWWSSAATASLGVAIAIAIVATVVPGLIALDAIKLLLFIGIAVLLPVGSWWWSNFTPEPSGSAPRTSTLSEFGRVGRAGDLLAGLVIAIFGLGLVRAFTAPAVLGLLPGQGQATAAATGPAWLFVVVGLALAIVGGGWLALLIPGPPRPRLRTTHPSSSDSTLPPPRPPRERWRMRPGACCGWRSACSSSCCSCSSRSGWRAGSTWSRRLPGAARMGARRR